MSTSRAMWSHHHDFSPTNSPCAQWQYAQPMLRDPVLLPIKIQRVIRGPLAPAFLRSSWELKWGSWKTRKKLGLRGWKWRTPLKRIPRKDVFFKKSCSFHRVHATSREGSRDSTVQDTHHPKICANFLFFIELTSATSLTRYSFETQRLKIEDRKTPRPWRSCKCKNCDWNKRQPLAKGP